MCTLCTPCSRYVETREIIEPTTDIQQLLAVWYFFVETRGYTLEQITTIFDTEGISWKQRRNLKPVQRIDDDADTKGSSDSVEQVPVQIKAE